MFGVTPEPWDAPEHATPLARNLATSPVALREVPDAHPLRDDWVVLRPRLTGICGSDAKQVLGDFEGDADSALSGMATFPQILGHEVVADVAELGPGVDRPGRAGGSGRVGRANGADGSAGVAVGMRVVVNPWLGCTPRGVTERCPACAAGDLSLCEHFDAGGIATGIHLGTSRDAGGGYAETMAAHPSMLHPVPGDIPDEVAVFADPFAVALHSVTRHPPTTPDDRVLVWGAGALGLCTVAILRALHPRTRIAVVARFDAQADLAAALGADHVVRMGSQAELLEELAGWSGGRLRETMDGLDGLPLCLPGGIAVAYDTIGKPGTLEIEARVLAARGTIVVTGVHVPGRWEWSPHYFKEIGIVGSNAFGVEQVDGVRAHAIDHYLNLVATGRIDLSAMLTHTFALSDWRDAFLALADQATSGAIKVAIDPRR